MQEGGDFIATITTHYESKANQYHAQGKTKNHEDKEEGVNFFTLCDKKPREEYKKVFGEALQEYNAMQVKKGHSERQIEDYYRHIQKDKKKNEEYEAIYGVYGDDVGEEEAIEILKDIYNTWEERNPNMHLYGFYIHADEESGNGFHAHALYFPVYHSERGLSVQNGIDKACREQGFGYKKKSGEGKHQTPQTAWEQSENAYLESLCNDRGIEVEHPQRDKNVEHLSVEAYKLTKHIEASRNFIKSLNEEAEELRTEAEALKTQNDVLQQNIAFSKQIAESYQGQIEQAKEELKEYQDEARAWQEAIREKKAEAREMVESVGSLDEYMAFCRERDLKPLQVEEEDTFDL